MALSNRFLSVCVVLAAAPALLGAPLMYRAETTISLPAAGEDVALSIKPYKGSQFEARVSSVRLELTGEASADPVEGDWTFLATNGDGQMHRVEITVRLQNESGKQVAQFSGKCILTPGARDQACKVSMKADAEDWKATKAVRIVTDWMS